ncbi:Beta-glucosidase 1B [Colletotrichum gloeosporioides]|uniref:Beta-glucosidase 1B n=1 Tax=Colletotrichum gloeosporioides TaxID=474922 RepID=A0A8H4CBL4_COLGL|nr:Beta-glucosidase 1B [Colletotrichum gloeosporioides]KAF3800769.1 Beta-glucosidase 1B [Colletotrichum gloeosporioides]
MSLPKDFIWGFGTASYQIEGAISSDGRLPSIWDTFCNIPGKIADASSGAVACDSYNRTTDDIALLKQYGAKAYRFSISSRVVPLGGRNDPLNEAGLRHYVNFVDALLEAGIQPMVTLYQWDLPEALQQRYGGLLDKDEFVADFAQYAQTLFRALPKVKIWMTFTEPWIISVFRYNRGVFAPSRCSDRLVASISASAIRLMLLVAPSGDSSLECWIVGHNILLAHATAVKIYREEFQSMDGGDWAYPFDTDDENDRAACHRFIDFFLGWFADPIYRGCYPATMKHQLGNRLPTWQPEEIKLVKRSNDFFALDYYSSTFVKHKDVPPSLDDYMGNVEVTWHNIRGEEVGPESGLYYMRPNAEGLRHLLNWIADRYGPKIYIVENGTSIKGENAMPMSKALDDSFRCDFYRNHINAIIKARVEDKSLLDNFEWADSYKTRFSVT